MVMTAEPSQEIIAQAGKVPYEESTITIFTGLRGSTKTCRLAHVAMEAMSEWNKPTYSNFAIGGRIMGKNYETEPLPNDVFVTYAKNIPPGSVLVVDEIQEFFDRQDWYSVQSKMGTSMFAQIRKLNITIFGATQFFNHLNSRIAEQVDFMIRCIDLHFSDWGRDNHIPKGEISSQDWYDLSGILGKSARNEFHPHLITGEHYRHTVFYAKACWEYFDSHKLTALNQRFQSFYLEKQKIKVDGNGGNGKSASQENIELKNYLVSTFNKLHNQGVEDIKANDLLDKVRADGLDVNFQQLGREVYRLGIEKNRTQKRGVGGFFYSVKPL